MSTPETLQIALPMLDGRREVVTFKMLPKLRRVYIARQVMDLQGHANEAWHAVSLGLIAAAWDHSIELKGLPTGPAARDLLTLGEAAAEALEAVGFDVWGDPMAEAFSTLLDWLLDVPQAENDARKEALEAFPTGEAAGAPDSPEPHSSAS